MVQSREYLVILIAEDVFGCLNRDVLLENDVSLKRVGVLKLSFNAIWLRWDAFFRPVAGLLSKIALYFRNSSCRNAASIDPRLMKGVLIRLLIPPTS